MTEETGQNVIKIGTLDRLIRISGTTAILLYRRKVMDILMDHHLQIMKTAGVT